jgi:hypothetical protein
MSDDIRIGRDEYAPIQDTICGCGHWYDEHVHGGRCEGCEASASRCACASFVADPVQSTPEAIAARGGDPELWPEHVKQAFA